MFHYRARTRNSAAFKRLVEAVRDISASPVLRLAPDRLAFQGMDAAHVLMAAFELGEGFFDEVECAGEVAIAVRTAALSKVLHFCEEGDILTFAVEASGDACQLQFDSGPAVAYERRAAFRLPLLRLEGEMLAVPPRSYEAVVSLPAVAFFALVRNLAQSSETVSFVARAKPRGFALSYEGKGGSGEVAFAECGGGAQQAVQLSVDVPVERQFSLALIASVARAAALSERVTLSFGKETPLLLSFALGGDSVLQVYVAPKATGD